MENIIKKAIEGGWSDDTTWSPNEDVHDTRLAFLDPLFWQALGKSCGWALHKGPCSCEECHKMIRFWNLIALRFHEINLTQSWSQAILYLEEIIK